MIYLATWLVKYSYDFTINATWPQLFQGYDSKKDIVEKSYSTATSCLSEMVLELKNIKDGVRSRLGIGVLKTILRSVQISANDLWGTEHPWNFILGMVLITLYKDMTVTSYVALRKEVASWAHLSNETIQHNVQKYHHALRKWVKSVLVPQAPAKLVWMAAKSNRLEGLDKVVLWVDSTYFHVKGKHSIHKDKARWSHKLHSPGRHWVSTLIGKIRFWSKLC